VCDMRQRHRHVGYAAQRRRAAAALISGGAQRSEGR
jgi:hypothetical protein